MGTFFRRKRNRLDPEVYAGNAAYFITGNVRGRRTAFVQKEVVEECVSMLSNCAGRCGIDVLAYCFMPDHLHLLLSVEDKADLTEFMRLFKQWTGYHFSRNLKWGGPFWQKSYYDHVLRGEEHLQALAEYIWENPVRAGLVENRGEYPFSGSLVAGVGAVGAWGEDVEG